MKKFRRSIVTHGFNTIEDVDFYYRNLIAAMPNNVYWLDKYLKGVGCNDNTLKLLGLKSIDEFVGISYEKMASLSGCTLEQVIQFKERDTEVIKTGIAQVNIEEKISVNKEFIYFLTSRVPLFDKKNNVIGVVGISTNITDRKRTEQDLKIAKEKAEIANKAKTEFLENMRHDIRTPLSGIVGCAQLIQMQANNPKKVAEYADDLVQSSDALLGLLNKVLESIQVASGEIPLLKKRFNLRRALEQIVQLNKPQAKVKHLNLQLDYDKTIPVYLLGDSVRVQRIILELLTNALKFTHKGEIKVVARLMKNKTQSGQIIVKLSVCDTGIGIPLAQQNEVYTRFKRLTPSYQGIYPGTGLGLSVVKQFMDDLDGEIQLHSKPNQGSTFTCLIPFQESLLTENGNEVEEIPAFAMDICLANKKVAKVSPTQETARTTGSRVLLVEDNLIAAKLAQNVLSNLNCRIDKAKAGKEALLCVEKNHYDLILMDVGLPDMDGSEVTRRIRLKQGQHNRSVPIIGLTAHIEIEKKQSCLANGMNAVYTKPLTPEKAREMLNVFISPSLPTPITINNALQDIALINVEQAIRLIGNKKLAKESWDLLSNSLTEELVKIKQTL